MSLTKKVLETFTLANGLQVALENIPYRNSLTAGIWTPVGSRVETDAEMGYSHFTEHMLFKGTKNRSYQDISLEVDRLGGYMNASTSKEVTNYHITISSKFYKVVFDILSDIFYDSTFPNKEFEVEKKVILEEIKMSKDNPDDLLFDYFYEDVFGDTQMGRPIAGTIESITDSNREKLYQYYISKYGVSGAVLSIAGNLWNSDAEELEFKNSLNHFFDRSHQFLGKPSLNLANAVTMRKEGRVKHYFKDLEQLHFAFGIPGIGENYQGKNTFIDLYTQLMGGTMSSRLFRKLREENGLCYSVGAYHSKYFYEGLWFVYCGTSEDTFMQAIDLMLVEMNKSLKGDISLKEFEETKSGLSGSIELSMESSSRRAGYNARSLLYHGKLRYWEERLDLIKDTTLEEMIGQLTTNWTKQNYVLTSLGDLDSQSTEDSLIKKYSPTLSI